MRRALRGLRLGEILALLWVAGAFTLFAVTGRFEGRLGSTRYFPFLHVALLTIAVMLLRLNLLSARRLADTWEWLRDPTAPAPAIGLDQELRLGRSMLGFLRDCLPLYVILFAYPTSDLLIDSLQRSRLADDVLIRLDLALFGFHASVWTERFATPWLTDTLSFCYFLHILLPPLVLVFIALKGPRAAFVEVVEAFVLMSLVGVSLYVAVPAVGPLHTLADLYQHDLAGGVVGQANRAFIESTRVPRDAFPSLHVGISALLLLYAARSSRLFALVLLPAVVGNWIATIYLRYHYLVDVVAGFALVPLVTFAVRAWTRCFGDAAGLASAGVTQPPAAEGGDSC